MTIEFAKRELDNDKHKRPLYLILCVQPSSGLKLNISFVAPSIEGCFMKAEKCFERLKSAPLVTTTVAAANVQCNAKQFKYKRIKLQAPFRENTHLKKSSTGGEIQSTGGDNKTRI